jgi:hypothetical protein
MKSSRKPSQSEKSCSSSNFFSSSSETPKARANQLVALRRDHSVAVTADGDVKC